MPKSAWHHSYPVFPWIRDILSWKKSSLVWSDILRLFVNTLNADNKYSNGNIHNFAQQIEATLCLKGKTFSGFSFAFLKCAWNFKHFEKKWWVSEPNYFRFYWLRKRWLFKHLKSLVTEHYSVINILTGSKQCWNQHGTTYYPGFQWIQDLLSWKMSILVWCDILSLLVNTLTIDHKYSRSNLQNFEQQVQTPLSQKGKTFSGFLIAFVNCAWNLNILKQKMSILA